MKRLSLFMSALLVALQLGCLSVLAADNIIVEGESYFKASSSTSQETHTALSGGKSMYVSIKPGNIPKNGVTILYKLQSPIEASYNMYITCPTIGVNWISPCEVRINDGEYERISDMGYEQVGTLNGTGVANNIYNKYKLCTVNLKKGINNVYIKIPEARQSDGQLIFYIDCMEFELLPWDSYDLSAGDLLSISEEKELVKPAIEFPYEDDEEHALTYSLINYFGEVIKEDSVVLRNVDKYEIPLDDKLPRGHYTVKATVDGQEEKEYYFSVVMDTEEREGTSNNNYMVDTAGNSLMQPQYIDDYAKSLKLAGVPSARERSSVSGFAKSRGSFDFSGFKSVYDAYTENGVKVMGLNATIPEYMKKNSTDIYPNDLVEVYDFFKALKQAYGEDFDMEAWNEPESAGQTADNLAAFIKAKTIGEIDSGVKTTHIGPGFCISSSFGGDKIRVPELTAQNDVLDYLDVWSYHAHVGGAGASTNLVEYKDNKKAVISYYHGMLDRYGYSNGKYIYNTEGGTTMPTDADENVNSQKFQARFAVTSMIDSVMSGANRHYWFVYPFYDERSSLWGTFTANHMPHSAYNSIAALTYAMADTEHIGEIEVEDAHCYIFNKKDKQLAVIYSENEKEITINSDAQKGTLFDIMGNESEISAVNGAFTITSGPDVQYLIIDSKFGNVSENALPKKEVAPVELTKAQRVILVQEYSDNCTFNKSGNGTSEYLLPSGEDATVTVRVTNLNDTAMNGKIVGTSFAGLEFAESEKSVSVDPYSVAEVTFTLKQTESLKENAYIPVKFEGMFENEKTSKSVTYVTKQVEQEINLKDTFIGFDNPENWKENIMSGGSTTIENEGDGVIHFVHKFADGDKWSYPYFDIQNENMEKASGIYYEIYFEDTVPNGNLRVFAHEKNGSNYLSGIVVTSGLEANKWNKVYFPLLDFGYNGGETDYTFMLEPEEIKTIQVGCNSREATGVNFDFKIRNLGYYEVESSSIKSNVSGLNAQVSGNSCEISALAENKEIGIDFDKTVIIIDGEEIKPEYTDGKISVTKSLSAGSHTAIVRALDLSGRNIGYETISFEVE